MPMTDRPKPLSIARAEDAGDCRLVPVKDLLIEALREIETEGDDPINNATGAILIFIDDSNKDTSGHSVRQAGVIRSEIHWWTSMVATETMNDYLED